jgi:hypothetical protein
MAKWRKGNRSEKRFSVSWNTSSLRNKMSKILSSKNNKLNSRGNKQSKMHCSRLIKMSYINRSKVGKEIVKRCSRLTRVSMKRKKLCVKKPSNLR